MKALFLLATLLPLIHFTAFAQSTLDKIPSQLNFSIGEKSFRVLNNMHVQQLNDIGNVISETTWSTSNESRENSLNFCFGETCYSTPIQYSLDKKNRLLIFVPQSTNNMKYFFMEGQIQINDGTFKYTIFDRQTDDLTNKIIQFPVKIKFVEAFHKMSLTLEDSSEIFVSGNNKHRSLNAEEYFSGGDNSRDSLHFSAATLVKAEDEENMINYSADIKFYGYWKVDEKQISFVPQADVINPVSIPVADIKTVKFVKLKDDYREYAHIYADDKPSVFIPVYKQEMNNGAYELKFGRSRDGAILNIPGQTELTARQKTTNNFTDRLSVTKNGSIRLNIIKFRFYFGPNGFLEELP